MRIQDWKNYASDASHRRILCEERYCKVINEQSCHKNMVYMRLLLLLLCLGVTIIIRATTTATATWFFFALSMLLIILEVG